MSKFWENITSCWDKNADADLAHFVRRHSHFRLSIAPLLFNTINGIRLVCWTLVLYIWPENWFWLATYIPCWHQGYLYAWFPCWIGILFRAGTIDFAIIRHVCQLEMADIWCRVERQSDKWIAYECKWEANHKCQLGATSRMWGPMNKIVPKYKASIHLLLTDLRLH